MCPPGLSHAAGPVCRIRRALYGLKQSPRAWYSRVHDAALQIEFQPSTHESALFTRRTPHGLVLLLLYADDMITNSDSAAIDEVKHHLFHEFDLK